MKKMRDEDSLIGGLVDMCHHIQEQTEVRLVCEIGSYLGESTIQFAKHFPLTETIFAIDPYSLDHNSDGLFDPALVAEIYEKFIENTKPYKTIKHLRMSSEEASYGFADGTIDFVYVDGCHLHESVLKDISSWKPKVRPGGFIAFHDVDNFGVRTAIETAFNIDEGHITEDHSISFRIDSP